MCLLLRVGWDGKSYFKVLLSYMSTSVTIFSASNPNVIHFVDV